MTQSALFAETPTVVEHGGFYLQGSRRTGFGWGQLSCAAVVSFEEYREVLEVYPNASWFSVLLAEVGR